MAEEDQAEGHQDDRRAFVALADAAARLDEAAALMPADASAWMHGARRREAAATAALEGSLVRQDMLCRLLSDRGWTGADRGARLAACLVDAAAEAALWDASGPSAEEVSRAFIASDASAGRLMTAEVQWSIEDDAAWTSETLSRLAETPEPWMAAEAVREIWASGRFMGKSRRMAMACAPWALSVGLSARTMLAGLAAQAAGDPDAFREASRDAETWAVLLASRAARAFRQEREALGSVAATRTTIEALCPPGRSSSKMRPAISWMFERPVFTARQMCEALDLTPAGAKLILDRMAAAGVVDVDGTSRNRKYSCRRTM